MTNIVYIQDVETPSVNKEEIFRYYSCCKENSEFTALIDNCLNECLPLLSYRTCYAVVRVRMQNDIIDFGFSEVHSSSLSMVLSGCEYAVIFAATVGIGIDRLISKYSKISQTKALAIQAIGTERIEALCDILTQYISEKYGAVKPRFSPGYGDLAMDFQRDIFTYLSCYKNIGLSLNDSMIMSPSKSVTAIIGLKDYNLNYRS